MVVAAAATLGCSDGWTVAAAVAALATATCAAAACWVAVVVVAVEAVEAVPAGEAVAFVAAVVSVAVCAPDCDAASFFKLCNNAVRPGFVADETADEALLVVSVCGVACVLVTGAF